MRQQWYQLCQVSTAFTSELGRMWTIKMYWCSCVSLGIGEHWETIGLCPYQASGPVHCWAVWLLSQDYFFFDPRLFFMFIPRPSQLLSFCTLMGPQQGTELPVLIHPVEDWNTRDTRCLPPALNQTLTIHVVFCLILSLQQKVWDFYGLPKEHIDLISNSFPGMLMDEQEMVISRILCNTTFQWACKNTVLSQ